VKHVPLQGDPADLPPLHMLLPLLTALVLAPAHWLGFGPSPKAHPSPPAPEGDMQRRRHLIARACGILAALCLAGMMLLTVADVTLRAISNTPIRGVYELIELLLAGTFFLALPAVFLRDDHILVNLFDTVAPRLVSLLGRVYAALAAIILGAIAWQGFLAAADSFAFNDMTADLGIPRVWHWAALLVGIVAAAVAALAMAWWRSGGSEHP
jgi:TRAP-type C4-dicarboxylate transport system permease small subunit